MMIKIITQPQIIPKEFYEYFDVISQIEFPNYYEIIIKTHLTNREVEYWLKIYGIKFYFTNQCHKPPKTPHQKTSYRKTLPTHYTNIELLKLKANNLI